MPGQIVRVSPPEGGSSGEQGDILIELCTEVYGLIAGPPGWRGSLLTTLKERGFKRHPLAPCVFLVHLSRHFLRLDLRRKR